MQSSSAHTASADLAARHFVWEALHDVVYARQSLDGCITQLQQQAWPERDRAFARQLLMLCLRRHGEAVAMLQPRIEKPLEGGLLPIHSLLVMGVAQMMWLETPAHAAIDTSVQMAKQAGFVHQAGMVNAILRRISEQREALLAASHPAYNLPSWLKGVWRKAYGREATDAIATMLVEEPPLDITVAADVNEWAQRLEARPLLHHTVRRPTAHVAQLAGYETGGWWVQDVAASLPVRLLGDVAGQRVVDLCAAPGGKTAQLAAAGATVVAVDRSAERMQRLITNMQRLRFAVETVVADVSQWKPESIIDAVVLDAPCTATGTARRHPDLLLHRSEKEVAEMVAIQRQLLQQVMQWLPVGARLVYSVCSLQPEEGEEQIAWLLTECPAMQRCALDAASLGVPPEWITAKGELRTLPHYWADRGGMDGFFAALMVKTA